MPVSPTRSGSERGQASAELVAASGIVVVLLLVVAQAAVVGYALWSAASGPGPAPGPPTSAATRWRRRGALCRPGSSASARSSGHGPIEVEVSAPALLPGLPPIRVGAATALGPEGAGG